MANRIATGLFCVMKSLNLGAPIVRVAENDALAESVCKQLVTMFGQEPQVAAGRRPLLILLNRMNDLHTMLYHGWNYLTMI